VGRQSEKRRENRGKEGGGSPLPAFLDSFFPLFSLGDEKKRRKKNYPSIPIRYSRQAKGETKNG
jgi:hypothetical protein